MHFRSVAQAFKFPAKGIALRLKKKTRHTSAAREPVWPERAADLKSTAHSGRVSTLCKSVRFHMRHVMAVHFQFLTQLECVDAQRFLTVERSPPALERASCVGAADSVTGPHARFNFSQSTSHEDQDYQKVVQISVLPLFHRSNGLTFKTKWNFCRP